MTNSIKRKLAVTGLVITLSLSGCTFKINKKFQKENKNKVLIENDDYNWDLNNDKLDEIMGFSKTKVDENKSYLDYEYLLIDSDTTDKTLAHVIDEKIITSDKEMFDGKKEVEESTFKEDIIQPIILPKAFILFHIDDMEVLIDAYTVGEIIGTKMITLDGDILYRFDSTLTFNDFAERFLDFDIKKGDQIEAIALYKLQPNGRLELLYRNQTGIKADTDNIVEANYNNSEDILIPLEEGLFTNNKLTKEEALDELENNYSSKIYIYKA